MSTLRPLREADLSSVEAVFTDVDGTLTSNGKLTSTTLRAIEWLNAVHVPVVLVSGRPSAWGEAWARQWPVAGAIMENGALHYAWRDGKLEKSFDQDEKQRALHRKRLLTLVDAAMNEVPGAKLSMDSAGTEVDVAIDYNEDVSLGSQAADALENFLRKRGVTAVRSSVHVNCWIGDFDKLKAVKRFVRSEWKKTIAREDGRYVYVGDSFNDAPMFRALSLSVGVANVKDVLDTITSLPKFVTRAREGKGFGEVADAIVRARKKQR